MRSSVCALLFCVLAIFFFFLYLIQPRPQPGANLEPILAVILTGLFSALFYVLYQFLRRLFRNRTLWRILFFVIIIVVVLLALSIPEVRRGISIEGARSLVFAVLCLILCGYCSTRPSRSTGSSG